MALPIVPALKLLALGSLKIIELGGGALFVPIFTVTMVIGGMGESVKSAANWLHKHKKLSVCETDNLIRLRQRARDAELERPQARALLFEMLKTVVSLGSAFRNGLSALVGFFKR